jgi:hypothetical protein
MAMLYSFAKCRIREVQYGDVGCVRIKTGHPVGGPLRIVRSNYKCHFFVFGQEAEEFGHLKNILLLAMVSAL